MRVDGQGMAPNVFSPDTSVNRPVNSAATVVKEPGGEPRERIGRESLSAQMEAKKIEELARNLNETVKFASCHLEFQPYEDSGRFQVKVVNSLSGEVIKEIPPDYLLDFSIKMKEMINQVVGLFVDELA